MADIVTGTVTGQLDNSALHQDHADIRREASQHSALGTATTLSASGDTRREQAELAAASAYQNATQHGGIVDSVKTAAWANSDRTGTEADRIVAQDTAYFIANQQNDFANATNLAGLKASVDMSFAKTQADVAYAGYQAVAAAQLEGAKTAAAASLGQALLGQQIVADGNSTRALVNELKMDQLNRELIERNAALAECRGDGRYWQGQFGNSQFSQLSNQVNALNSQMTETRQGMVNFGTMAGVGQSSTSNNVR